MATFAPNDQVLITDTATTGLGDVTHGAFINSGYARVVRQSTDLLTLWVQPAVGYPIYQIPTSAAAANSDSQAGKWQLTLPTITVRANHVSQRDDPN